MDPTWRSEFRRIFAVYGALGLIGATMALGNIGRLFFATSGWPAQTIAMVVFSGAFGVPIFRLGFRFWRLLPLMDEADRLEAEEREVRRQHERDEALVMRTIAAAYEENDLRERQRMVSDLVDDLGALGGEVHDSGEDSSSGAGHDGDRSSDG